MYFVDLSALNVDGPNVTRAPAALKATAATVVSVLVPCGDPLVGDPLVGDPLVGDPLVGDPPVGDPPVGDPLVGVEEHGEQSLSNELLRLHG